MKFLPVGEITSVANNGMVTSKTEKHVLYILLYPKEMLLLVEQLAQ